MKFSMVRSAISTECAEPLISAITSPAFTAFAVACGDAELDLGIDHPSRERRRIEARHHARLARTQRPAALRSGSISASVVTSPATPRSSCSASLTIGSSTTSGSGGGECAFFG